MKTIVWDIDDVLNAFTRTWFTGFWLPMHPDCNLEFNDLTENPPHRLLGVEKREYLESLDRFRLSPEADSMPPDLSVQNWFKKCGGDFRHIALTARSRQTVVPAIAWLIRHYGQWFQTFSFVPSEREGEAPGHPDREKRDFLQWLDKADFFIDDNPDHVLAANLLGITSFLVAQPWNGSDLSLMETLNTIVIQG